MPAVFKTNLPIMYSLITSQIRRLTIFSCKRLPSDLKVCLSNGEPSSERTFKTFQDMMSFRRTQAQNSALIAVNFKSGLSELINICENFGTLKEKLMFEPRRSSKNQLVCLVEYESEDQLERLLRQSGHFTCGKTFPVASRLLTFSDQGQQRDMVKEGPEPKVKEWHEPSQKNLCQMLSSCKNISEEMELIFKHECIQDMGVRLRFLICAQIEDSLKGLFPECQVLPFGSSVSGFGSYKSDLDVSLHMESTQAGSIEGLNFQVSSQEFGRDRLRTQRMLGVLGDMMASFFPSISNVQYILRARVPIIKMHHNITNIDCDISCSNLTGYCMSELLYLFGELDPRVRPLVFAIRKWAQGMLITRETAGNFITNFSLSLLVIFFLQNQSPPVLPSVQRLEQFAGPEDWKVVEGANCTFKRTFSEVPKSSNTQDAGELLISFFTFYEKLKWEESAVSIVSGQLYNKPDMSAMFIQNPLERSLNVSKTVSLQERERFRAALQVALFDLDTNTNTFFGNLIKGSLSPRKFVTPKGVNVHVLFEKTEGMVDSSKDSLRVQDSTQASHTQEPVKVGENEKEAAPNVPKQELLRGNKSVQEVQNAASSKQKRPNMPKREQSRESRIEGQKQKRLMDVPKNQLPEWKMLKRKKLNPIKVIDLWKHL